MLHRQAPIRGGAVPVRARGRSNVTWRSFELDPSAPAELSGNGAARIAEKYGVRSSEPGDGAARDRAPPVTGSSTTSTSTAWFDLRRTPAGSARQRHGLQDAMKERLIPGALHRLPARLRPETLVALAVEVGLPEARFGRCWTRRVRRAVRDDEQHRARSSASPASRCSSSTVLRRLRGAAARATAGAVASRLGKPYGHRRDIG